MIVEHLRHFLNQIDYDIEKGNLENAQKDFGEWSRLKDQNVVSDAAYQSGIEKAARQIDTSAKSVQAILEASDALKRQMNPDYQRANPIASVMASFLGETPAGIAAPRKAAGMESSVANQEMINQGWVKTQKPGSLPDETMTELSPEEAQAAESGYTPPKAEVTGRMYAPEGQQMPETSYDQPPAPEGRKKARQQAQSDFIQASNTQPRQRTYRDYINDPSVPEMDRHETKRKLLEKQKQIDAVNAQKHVDAYFPLGTEEHNRALDSLYKQIDRQYNPEDFVPVEKTDTFKAIASKYNNDQYRRSISAMANFRGELEKAVTIKDPVDKSNYLMAQMPKMLNTLAADSSDAVGIEEFKKLAPELMNIWNSPIKDWGELIRQNGAKLFQGDPDAFIKKATSLYNVGASNMNNRVAFDEKVLGSHTYKTTAVKMNPLAERPEPGKETPAQMEVMRSGKSKSTTPYVPVNKADPRGNQPMVAPVTSTPLPTGKVAPKGIFMYGPTRSQADILEGGQY